jgi:hypothetical protein
MSQKPMTTGLERGTLRSTGKRAALPSNVTFMFVLLITMTDGAA